MTQSGQLIKNRRKFLKIKQTELAGHFGVTPQYLNNIEAGKALPPANMIVLLSMHLKLNKKRIIDSILKDIRKKFYNV